jgi:hypothetical protein
MTIPVTIPAISLTTTRYTQEFITVMFALLNVFHITSVVKLCEHLHGMIIYRLARVVNFIE